ncbi:MAG: hypothetical protein H6660_04810 [Ardenticatenaceae bacterium]|nr:hypothetical protein [Ardenticatenaceae bacterium]
MLIFLIAVGIVILVIVVGLVVAGVFSQMDSMVTKAQKSVETTGQGYKPALSMGFAIDLNADPEAQVLEARRLAAQKAAALPRGANMGIGRLGHSTLKTAFAGVKDDPMTAAKIAAVHGWDGVRTGPVAATAVAAPAAAAAPAASGEINLVPGKDYPVIAITDDMSDAEKRKARIENSKAKSKAMKAAKEAQKAGGVVATAAAPAAAAAPVAAVAPAAAAGIPEPNYIEITDSMSPDDVRKARIHNSKERSKYNKALKAAGVDPEAAAAPAAAPQPVAAVQAAPAPAPTADAALAGIPQPDYIEITDSMSADDVRKARIQNAKERSKYNKALKAAGIDPKSVE